MRPFRSSGVQEFRSSGVQEFRSSGVQEFRSSGVLRMTNMSGKSRANLKNSATVDDAVSAGFILQLLNSCNS
jgi:hypothetical protein